jgi:hypothetical protein
MRTKPAGTALLAMMILSACGAGDLGKGSSPSASPSIQVAGAPGGQPAGEGAAGGAGGSGGPGGAGAAGPGGAGAAGGAGGAGSNSITHVWSEEVMQSGGGIKSLIRQQYKAVVSVTLTKVDLHAWTLTGQATIAGAYTSDYESRQTTPLGPCNVHYTDNASGGGSVAVDGGLEASDGFYQFHVNIGGLDGSNETVRDDSGCNGTNIRETTPWSVAPDRVGGSGDYTGNAISGSERNPREGGQDVVSWSITLTE